MEGLSVTGSEESFTAIPFPEKTVVPPDHQFQLVILYNGGMSLSQLSKKFYYGINTVRRVLLAHGVQMRPMSVVGYATNRRDPEKIAMAVELYKDGMSSTEAGRVMGISPVTVRTYIKVAGLECRSIGKATQISFVRNKRHHNMKQVIDVLKSAEGPLSTKQIKDALDFETSISGVNQHLRNLERYGLAKVTGKAKPKGNLWVATDKDIREILANLDPDGHYIDSEPKHRLPARPLLKMFENMLARETQKVTYSGMSYCGTQGENGSGPLDTVCRKLGITQRGILRWRRGESLKTDFDTADKLVTRSPYLWYEVFNEATTRLPEFTIVVIEVEWKKNKAGEDYWSYGTGRQFPIGDAGPDLESLELVRQAFSATAELVA